MKLDLYNKLMSILNTMEALVDKGIAQLEALEQEELDEMKAFEIRFNSEGLDMTRYDKSTGWSNTKTYFHPHIESMWKGWKAAKGI